MKKKHRIALIAALAPIVAAVVTLTKCSTDDGTVIKSEINGEKNVVAGRDVTQNFYTDKGKDDLKQGEVRIVDLLVNQFPHNELDFRIENTGATDISISRVLFKVIKIVDSPTFIGGQSVSQSVDIWLDSRVEEGDVLESNLALKLSGHEQDRFTVNIEWKDRKPDISKTIFVIPALKTSRGYVQGKLITIYIQKYVDPDSGMTPDKLGLDVAHQQAWKSISSKNIVIDWEEETNESRVINVQ